MRLLVKLLLCVFLFAKMTDVLAMDLMFKADSLFELRNEGFEQRNFLSDSVVINQALEYFATVLDHPDGKDQEHEAVWKTLQAIYYKGQYAVNDKEMRRKIYSKGLSVGEKYVLKYPDSAEINCWMGILWSRWSEVYGILAAARKGVANKVKYFGEKTIECNESYLDAGGYRMLGMAYLKVPKIPIILNWPSKQEGLKLLEKAYDMAPENLFNKLYLAEGYIENKEKDRARAILDLILNQNEIVHDVAMDNYVIQEAKNLLQKIY